MSIRKKLLLVIACLLVLATGLSFVLHQAEARRIRDEFRDVVDRVFDRLELEGGGRARVPPDSGAPMDRTESFVVDTECFEGTTRDGTRVRILRSELRGVTVLLEPWPAGRAPAVGDGDDLELDPIDLHDFLPPRAVDAVRMEIRDPIEAARRESLPRELAISGAVLVVGLGLTWFVAGRLSRPLKTLTARMESVAGGDLDSETPRAPRPHAGGNEVRQMEHAFSTMVTRLREKAALEKKVFESERLAALGNLAAGVAHDIRNPLNTLGLTLSHLRERYAPAAADDHERFLRHIDDARKEIDRLNDLVRNFLSLARPDGDELRPARLRDLVDDSLRLLRQEAESQGIVVNTRFDDETILPLSSTQMRRALANVFVNALQAMAPGGSGRLDVSVTRRRASNGGSADGPGEAVVLRIADSGPGIPHESIDKVFLPYYTTRDDGTGLGLAITRAAVEGNGGQVELESDPGRGTAVSFVFPIGSGGGDGDAP